MTDGSGSLTLAESQRYWNAHARRDPFWAVLSDPGKDERRWDVRRFFDTGVHEIAAALYQVDQLGVALRRGRALDFGCGVGRLTQALGGHFDEVVGVDVSPGMIENACALNGDPGKVSYVCNGAPDLRIFPDRAFDFVYTSHVLQHIEPDLAAQYLDELVRVLADGGVLVFQLPSHRRAPDEPLPVTPVVAMPDDAYAAGIVVREPPTGPVSPDSNVTLQIEITNRTGVAWLQERVGPINVGNHWFDRTGERMLQQDDARAPLAPVLLPAETCRIALTVKAPHEPGEYRCVVDLAHEGVRWFVDRGSSAAHVPVQVGTPAGEPLSPAPARAPQEPAGSRRLHGRAPGDLSEPPPGEFPMHGVHTDTVAKIIAGRGAALLERLVDRGCGDDWVSYSYFVRGGSARS